MIYSLDSRELPRLLPDPQSREVFLAAALAEGEGEGAPMGRSLAPGQVRRGLAALGFVYRPRVLAFINLKGGVGKTTSAVTLASRAVQLGFRTCLIDMDSQASASLALGVEAEEDTPVFHDVWQRPQEMVPGSLIRLQEYFHLLPSSLENGLLDSGLHQPAALKNAAAGVTEVLAGQGFDLAVLDCPPSLGPAVVTSVCAAHTIIIPLGCDAFSLRGMQLTLREVRSIRETFGLALPEIRLLLTGVDRRIKLWRTAWRQLERDHGELLLPAMIRTSSEVPRALGQRRTLFAGTANSPAREDYDHFARAVLGLTPLLDREHGHD
jgi:chromosome partitioning protein